jgi:beta-galactosidase
MMRRLVAPLDTTGLEVVAAPGDGSAFDPAAVDRAVAAAVAELGLPAWGSDPAGVFVTVHEDDVGTPRVLFVIHPGAEDIVARVSVPEATRAAVDLLDGTRVRALGGSVELRMPPRTVRMLAIER